FWMIALGEIFLMSTSYEVAFTYSPVSVKAVASAFNLCFFAIASALSAVLFSLCHPWLPDFDPANPAESSHKGAHYDYYYYLLIGLCLLGAIGAIVSGPYFKKGPVEEDDVNPVPNKANNAIAPSRPQEFSLRVLRDVKVTVQDAGGSPAVLQEAQG
ncbi:hypothetical protein FOZ62_005414, partial [Perkinsus olseni]